MYVNQKLINQWKIDKIMKKDKTIKQFLEKLKSETKFTNLEIVDYWDADLCAIGLKNENRLIYISTFNHAENSILKYDFDLELINKDNNEKIEIIKEGRGVSEAELLNEIRAFLNV